MRYTFVIPPVASFVSGGNLYNRSFTEALAKIADVQTYRIEEWMINSDDDATVIVDSIYLNQLNPGVIHAGRNHVLLLHYLAIFFERKDDQQAVARTLELLQCFHYFIATGQYVQDWLLAQGIKKESIFLFEPVISRSIQKSVFSISGPLQVLMLGNLVPVKGYWECLIELNQQQPGNIRVEIVGDTSIDPTYASMIQELIASSDYLSTSVNCRDAVPHDQVVDLFERCDVLLSASQFETFGIAIHEALAFQLPVAALTTGNVAYIQHPKLFKYDSIVELVSSLHEQNRARLTSLPIPNEISKPAASWLNYATLFHTHFSGLIE